MNPLSVTSLNEKIKSLLEVTFEAISVEGEISSVTYHNSGHIYFSIKDEKSALRCVMWRSNASKLKFRLEKGEHIVVFGNIGVYTPRGEYQLIARSIEPYGKGSLALAFEQMKKRLSAKGYFDRAGKKPIPPFPSIVAVVTAQGGAALQDMTRVAARRWPLSEIVLFDTPVQGEGAAESIARAIAEADEYGADVIVVGRGGGSIEDLWAFNEEPVADAIFRAKTPVVSAVGHEVDTLISDFVADLRAPTPSAAMEMILPDADEMLFTLDELEERMRNREREILSRKSSELDEIQRALKNVSVQRRLKMLQESFVRVEHDLDEVMRYRLSSLSETTLPVERRLSEAMSFVLKSKSSQIERVCDILRMNDPRHKIKEGWAEVSKDGRRVPLSSLAIGDTVVLADADNVVEAVVREKREIAKGENHNMEFKKRIENER